MLKKFLEQKALMGYAIKFFYCPETKTMRVNISKDGKEIEDHFDTDYLKDDLLLMNSLRDLIAKMEGAENV